MTELAKRRRALMSGGRATVKLVPGTYSRGTSSWTVEQKSEIVIQQWDQSSQNALLIPLSAPIIIKQGDAIVITILRRSGTPGWKAWDFQLRRSASTNLFQVASNAAMNLSNYENTLSSTSTASGTATHIYINSRSPGYSGYRCAIRITINGKVVLT